MTSNDPAPSEASTLGTAPLRIVIAEDEALIRLDLKESLIEEGYEVVGEAADGAEAIRLVEELRPDVAVLDIKMPGTDGLVAAQAIIERHLSAVVILTAFSQRDLIAQARDAGALAYVVKPFHRNELIPAKLVEMSDRVEELADQLETRKVLDRAKGRLMDEHGLAEQDAFRFIQKQAMANRSTMRAVAEQVVDGTLEP